jgi:flagellar biosynthesis protein FlhB
MTPGAEQAIQAAAQTGRWEAVALVVIMLAVTGFLVYVVKQIMAQALEREKHLGKRIDDLENFIRTSLLTTLQENTKAMLNISVTSGETTAAIAKLIESLHTTRICFATGEQQTKLVDTIATRVVNRIQQAARDHQLEVREP